MPDRKNKGGRPPKTDDEKRSETVRFRITLRQMTALRNKAKKSRLTLSEYARNMTLNGKVTAPATPEELALIAELTREKNNLNQLAKAANARRLDSVSMALKAIIIFYAETIAKLKRR